jgi:hypothetical protein
MPIVLLEFDRQNRCDNLSYVSRAFIKEDAAPPETAVLGRYRVYWGLSRHDIDILVVHSSDDLLDVLQWAQHQRGYHQIRDHAGKMLAEID